MDVIQLKNFLQMIFFVNKVVESDVESRCLLSSPIKENDDVGLSLPQTLHLIRNDKLNRQFHTRTPTHAISRLLEPRLKISGMLLFKFPVRLRPQVKCRFEITQNFGCFVFTINSTSKEDSYGETRRTNEETSNLLRHRLC